MQITMMVEETKNALQELTAHTYCRTDRERAKYIYGAKYPELCKLPPIVIDNIAALAEGNKTL